MLTGLGRLLHRRRWIGLVVIVGGILVAGFWGLGVLAKFKNGGYDDPKSSSSLVTKLGSTYFGSTNPDILILYSSGSRTVDDPAYMRDVITTIARLPKDRVSSEVSYWTLDEKNAKSLASADRHSTIVSLMMAGKDDKTKADNYLWVKDRLAAPGLDTHLGGAFPLGTEFGEQVVADIVRAETITALPLFLLLIMLFGAVGASVLPLFVALFSMLGGLAVLHGISFLTDVNSMALEVVTMMGVGLAIDYSLFIISRYREEYAKALDEHMIPPGKPWKQFPTRRERRAKRKAYKRVVTPLRQAALGRTMATAGRTIIVSGITVSAALSGLLVFPQLFLRTIGLAGIATVLVAVLGATLLLPTLLAVFGRGVEWMQMPWRRRRSPKAQEDRFWFRLGTSVMKHPLPYFAVVLVALAVMAGPFLNIRFGALDVRQLPEGSTTRTVVEKVQKEFPSGSAEPIDVVVSGDLIPKDWRPSRAGDNIPQYLEEFRVRLTKLPGVNQAKFSGYSGDYGAVRISVYTKYAPMDDRSFDLVAKIRDMTVMKNGYPMHLDIGGTTAMQADQMSSLMRSLPKMAAVVGASTFLLLFMFFGSILLPLKAIVMNVLSIGASFGAIVWGFQYGHLAGVLHFTPTDSVEATSMILILAVVFGLSMDYEVFLLSRIREEWDHTHDNRAAVARGMQYTGGIISSAAVLFLLVIGAFGMAGITVVKLIGVGMFVAVVVDAALVRALLVPATMRFLGAANWWLPGFLAGLHAKVDLREVSDAGGAGPAAPPPLPEDQPFSYRVQWAESAETPVTTKSIFANVPAANPPAPVPDSPTPRPPAARTSDPRPTAPSPATPRPSAAPALEPRSSAPRSPSVPGPDPRPAAPRPSAVPGPEPRPAAPGSDARPPGSDASIPEDAPRTPLRAARGADEPWRPWADGPPEPRPSRASGERREIVPSPTGSGWVWRTVPDDE